MRNDFTIKYLVLLFLQIFLVSQVAAQREKNNIYLFDCTGSMIKNGLWTPAKESLDATVKLDATIPGSHVTIIPFGNEPYEVFSFDAKDYPSKSKEIFNSFNNYIQKAQYTHISDVMEEGLKHIDSNKDNRIYLLTDGQPNQGDTPEKVAETISRWCSRHKNSRFFYVALTKGAIDDKIREALEACPDAFIVEIEGNVIPQFADLSSDVYTNLQELSQPQPIEFNLPGEYNVVPIANDSLFNVRIEGNKASNGKIMISFSPKPDRDLEGLHQILRGQEYEFPVEIQSVDKRYYIVNPAVTVHVADEIPSKLTLAGGQDEMKVEGVKWHDSFLWNKAAEDRKIVWDLNPVFESALMQSGLKLKFEASGGANDFKAWYNDEPINNGDIISINPGKPAVLAVQFDHNASTGKRYFELIPTNSADIDMINNRPARNYEGTTLRTTYDIGWNPLATVLFWIAIGLLALLVLWFLFLQRFFYPRIKMGRVEFTGPGSYYQTKKIKGARKVVVTSQKRKQNIFSRIFTGEIKYVKAPHFEPELAITPASGKKKVKVSNLSGKVESGWDISPSSIFKQYDKGSVRNRKTKEETKIEFS